MAAGKNSFIIVRDFQAPKELVFDAFAESEALTQWWGPKEMALTVLRLEFRPQGIFHYRMTGSNGESMYARFVYEKISRPDLLEFITSFTDPEGNVIRAPFFDNWPMEVYTKITFTENKGITTMTLLAYPVNASTEEEARFYSIAENMQQGYGGTFDKLDIYLNKVR
jgi:uncharacterized protein YndB with AHSA1/START domain